MILDSNIIVYAAQPSRTSLRNFIFDYATAVSIITHIEVLGFHKLTGNDEPILRQLLSKFASLPLTNDVVERAIALRQRRKMALGDALIAGTALVHELPLITNNVNDFQWISGLKLVNPLHQAT
jgi:toxin FitB